MLLTTLPKTIGILSQFIDDRRQTLPAITGEWRRRGPLSAADECPGYRPAQRALPSQVGLDPNVILNYVERLSRENDEGTLNLHTVTVAKDGKILFSAPVGPYRTDIPQHIFSASKSITSLAVGILCGEGKLNLSDRLSDIFPEETGLVGRIITKDLTIKRLLTMTSGVVFNEAEAMACRDWTKEFLSSPLLPDAGKSFNYNSLNSYMLSAAVRRITGEGLCDYLRPRLFDPLGIRDYLWQKSPEGIELGGWGLYMLPEDMVKIASVVLDDGMYNGVPLIPADYLREATKAQTAVSEEYGDYDYGYQFWVSRRDGQSFLFNGMLGQNTLVFRKSGVIVSVTGGNGELFQQSPFYRITEEAFSKVPDELSVPEVLRENEELALLENASALLGGEKLPSADVPDHRAAARFGKTVRALLNRRIDLTSTDIQSPKPYLFLVGKRYEAVSANAVSVGLLPVMMQAIQNNYAHGLTEVGFSVPEGVFSVTIRESDREFHLPLDFDKTTETILDFNGEKYRTAVTAAFTTDEDDNPVLKLRLDFLEIPSSRMIKMFFLKDGMKMRLEELPGERFTADAIFPFFEDAFAHALITAALGKGDEDYVLHRIRNIMSPEVLFAPSESVGQAAGEVRIEAKRQRAFPRKRKKK